MTVLVQLHHKTRRYPVVRVKGIELSEQKPYHLQLRKSGEFEPARGAGQHDRGVEWYRSVTAEPTGNVELQYGFVRGCINTLIASS